VAELQNEPFQDHTFSATDNQLSYRMMSGVPAELSWKQSLLELRSEPERLTRVIDYYEKLLKQIEAPAAPRKIARAI
jgi:hypothetical protein